MPSQKQILVKACAANGLGTSGSVTTLLQRLIKGSEKNKAIKKKKQQQTTSTSAKRPLSKTVTQAKYPSPAAKTKVVKPSKTTAFKTVGNTKRLSASYYFHDICGGKISRCTPQKIASSDGRLRLKEIKIVPGKSGCHPIWVLVKN